MSALKFIGTVLVFIFFLYWTITAVQNYLEAQKEVEIAQKEVDIATAEYVAANEAFQVEANRVLKEMGH